MSNFLITGANRGIGLEYCRKLQDLGDQVIAVCRTPSPELESLGLHIVSGNACHLARLASPRRWISLAYSVQTPWPQ
jgi:NAD(P)-dependent dehydrogenase (short-subunit alcohol dehydrogenase family)